MTRIKKSILIFIYFEVFYVLLYSVFGLMSFFVKLRPGAFYESLLTGLILFTGLGFVMSVVVFFKYPEQASNG